MTRTGGAVCPDPAGAASGPLAGRELLLLRPAGEARSALARLRRLGACALNLPVLRLAANPPCDPCWQALHAAPAETWLLPVSPFAARLAVRALGASAACRRWLAVGPGTALCLRRAGAVRVRAPGQRHDSEGLLELPELQSAALSGTPVLLLGAPGGRRLLADTLSARGAQFNTLWLYHREPARLRADVLRRLDAMRAPSLFASSAAALRALSAAAGDARLQRLQALPVLVPGPRLAAIAAELGYRRTFETGSASIEHLIDVLVAAAPDPKAQGDEPDHRPA